MPRSQVLQPACAQAGCRPESAVVRPPIDFGGTIFFPRRCAPGVHPDIPRPSQLDRTWSLPTWFAMKSSNIAVCMPPVSLHFRPVLAGSWLSRSNRLVKTHLMQSLARSTSEYPIFVTLEVPRLPGTSLVRLAGVYKNSDNSLAAHRSFATNHQDRSRSLASSFIYLISHLSPSPSTISTNPPSLPILFSPHTTPTPRRHIIIALSLPTA